MYNRVVIFFSAIMFSFCILILSIYSISTGDFLHETALNQSTYKLDVANLRGNIYDYRLKPLTGIEHNNVAVVLPGIETANVISKVLEDNEKDTAMKMCSAGSPFIINLKQKELTLEGADIFKVPIRYQNNQLCPHIIGYLDGSRSGVCGIEKAYNEYLSNTCGNIYVKYKVDAIGHILPGEEKIIDDKSYLQTKGIVLTIDSRLQKIAEEVAAKYIYKGAIIITEVPNCEIRAMVSLPSFSPNNVNDCLSSEDSPLINRALSSYNIGSIFKLITAATALENGISQDFSYDCSGEINVEDVCFHCFDGVGHKTINMKNALAYSCNTYFVKLSQYLNVQNLLNMSKAFGLGNSFELAPGLSSESGILPDEKALLSKKELANFSFGQGTLMTTPIQISGLINAIAAKGIYTEPKLVEGIVNENLEMVSKNDNISSAKVISQETAAFLKESMKASVEYGTSSKGKPSHDIAAAKTATAETGITVNGENVIQTWYAGMYPEENPKYSIVILSENGVGGGESCGPVFKEIVDEVYENLKGMLVE